jgi:hypothetical protein
VVAATGIVLAPRRVNRLEINKESWGGARTRMNQSLAKLWCEAGCGRCIRHRTCSRRQIVVSQKIECRKGANGKAFAITNGVKPIPNYVQNAVKRAPVSKRPQRGKELVIYVEDVNEVIDDETTSQRAVQSLEDLCLAFPSTISMHNMSSWLGRDQLNAGTVIRGMGNAQRAEETMVNLMRGIMERCAAIILPGDPDFLLSGATEMLRAKRSKPSVKKQR